MSEPRTLPWDQAPMLLLQHLRTRGSDVGVIGITGPVGAGKSYLTKRLCELGGVHLATDDYLPDYDKVRYEDRDDPAQADTPLLIENLSTLRSAGVARVPNWSFQTHSRVGYREVAPAPVVIVEGIHALHEQIVPHLDVCVFVDAPASVRWQRWEYLEVTGQRGWGVEVARAFFKSVAEPTFEKLAPVYRSRAHFVVRNDAGVPRA
ncbi:MAG: hypothetical protein JSS51_10275 [Planctomycetes bacterium]|nr:hypothetical protein [Planctomycetota bacterium]